MLYDANEATKIKSIDSIWEEKKKSRKKLIQFTPKLQNEDYQEKYVKPWLLHGYVSTMNCLKYGLELKIE